MEKIKNSSILYIEDDEITRNSIGEFLNRVCNNVFLASNGKEALELFEKNPTSIVITDIEMPFMDGLTLAKKIREKSKNVQIIVITAYTNNEYLLKAVNLHLIKYISKPLNLNKLIEALNYCEEFLNSEDLSIKYFSKNKYYDTYSKKLIENNNTISLSKKERDFLELLIKNNQNTTSYEQINALIYEYASNKNAIKILAKNLRAKIGKESLENVAGFGYKLIYKDKI